MLRSPILNPHFTICGHKDRPSNVVLAAGKPVRRGGNQAANAAVKCKGSMFEILYRRYVPRLGHNSTIGLIAHRLCRLICPVSHMRAKRNAKPVLKRLLTTRKTEATDGNLGAQLLKLEEAGYVAVEKKFVLRKPRTRYRITEAGRQALTEYVRALKQLLGPAADS
jgi:Winged helix DNA-binding domain